MLSRFSIPKQFMLLGVLGAMLSLTGLAVNLFSTYNAALRAKEAQTQNLVEAAVSITPGFVALAQAQKLSTAAAQRDALTLLGAARFDNGNYYFVYDYSGKVLQHARKNWIGTNRYRTRDIYGTLINGPMIEAARSGHPMFHEYYLPKANSTVPEPKLSIMIAVPQWGWVIGTGMYIDDVRAGVLARLRNFLEIFVPLFLGLLILILYMRATVSALLAGMSHSMDLIAQGSLDAVIPGIGRQDDLGRMAQRLTEFRNAAIEKRQLENDAAAAAAAATAAQLQRDAEREAAAREQQQVVDSVAHGLQQLAAIETLSLEAEKLAELVGHFNTEAGPPKVAQRIRSI